MLEALVAIALVSIVLCAVFAALATAARGRAADEARANASDAAANAAAELRAAVEYDPNALAAVGAASWTVAPPSPPPGAPLTDAAPITLTTTVAVAGASTTVGLSFSSADVSGATNLVLQQYAPAPGSEIFAPDTLPSATPGGSGSASAAGS